MPGNQLQACHTQHEDLIDQLTAKGTPIRNIKLIPILLGHSGTIYTEHTLQGMETLGISKQCAKKCAQKMHIDAIKQLHSINKSPVGAGLRAYLHADNTKCHAWAGRGPRGHMGTPTEGIPSPDFSPFQAQKTRVSYGYQNEITLFPRQL